MAWAEIEEEELGSLRRGRRGARKIVERDKAD
jgi:hypothetical protein